MRYNEYIENMKKQLISENSQGKTHKILFDEMKIHLPDDAPKTLLVKHDLQVLIGGYWNGMMVVQNYSQKYEIGKKKHLFRITMIQVSPSEETIITGTEKGDIAKWNNQLGNIKFEANMFHHQDEITSCWIEEQMGVFAT